MTQQQAEALAQEILEAQENLTGCDAETPEQVNIARMAVLVKKVADWIAANP